MENEEEASLNDHSHLYHTLECGADGKPGGILITSVGQQVLPQVWIGGYKAYESRSFLNKNRITRILSLGHFKPLYAPTEFVHEIIPIADNPESNIIQHFPKTFELIDTWIAQGQNILVHCLAGVSRSPTVVTAYLMKKRQLHPKAALAVIKQMRPFVNPNPGFMNQLRLYQDMNCEFDPNNPVYIAYHQKHPYDASHIGHKEYESER
ncbi:protein-tyrosine phosphatase-like protein [Radiomyces spectabilis]|uniref:protein-tyrosine phosphatase-like protein n=1 Tax=Radiomyces spectabilis TaxID=64574 RepID=UPI00221F24DF|nr:protein-tyrosine phosphatase-like protein [Radiomyces spectabilis]KAI8388240.1 protein-tyrosine phosphatase-like protein [Radiomyces spectabilis]